MKTEEQELFLDAVAPKLGQAYLDWKTAEAEKNAFKRQFFDLADQALEERGLAIKLVEISAKGESAAVARVKLHYPAWTTDESRPHRWKEGIWEVLITENPALKAFSHEQDGVKYARTIRRGSVMLDTDWLQEENPELYAEITYELPWGERAVYPLEQMDKAVLGQITKYIYNDAPRAALAEPKPIREEE